MGIRARKWALPRAALFIAVALLLGCAASDRRYHAWREYERALGLFRAGKYEESREHVQGALGIVPDQPEYLSLLAWTLFRQSRVEEARSLFSRIHEMDSKGVSGPQGLAWVEYYNGQYEDSEKWFAQELWWATNHMESDAWPYYRPLDTQFVNSIRSDANYGLGLIAMARGRTREAAAFLSEAVTYPNAFIGQGPILMAFGDLYFGSKEYETAARYYEKASALKNDPATAAKRAWCLYHLGDKKGADQLFQRLASSAADRRPGLYGLVFTRSALGQSAEGRDFLKELIRIDPYFPDTADVYDLILRNDWRLLWKDFAEAYFERGNFAGAAFKLEGYLPLAKKDGAARLMSGWCTLSLKGPQAALDEFTTLAQERLCPADQTATGRGVALLYLNRLDESARELERASRQNPANVRAAVALGAVAFLKGRYEAAVAIYRENLERLPKEEKSFSWPSHALNNLGWSYIRTGKYPEALQTFRKLQDLHRNPIYPEIFDGQGWALFHLHRNKEAKEAFERALGLSPQFASSRSGLASLAAEQK